MRLFLITLVGGLSVSVSAEAVVGPKDEGCFALKSAATGRFMSHNGPMIAHYTANRPEAKGWEAFRLQKDSASTYLILGSDQMILMGSGSTVGGGYEGQSDTSWEFVPVGDQWAIKLKGKSQWLSADKVIDGIVSLKSKRQAWELWTLVPTSGCADIGLVPSPAGPRR